MTTRHSKKVTSIDVSRRVLNLYAAYPNRGKRARDELQAQSAQYQAHLGGFSSAVLDRVLGPNNPSAGAPGTAHKMHPSWMPTPAECTAICEDEKRRQALTEHDRTRYKQIGPAPEDRIPLGLEQQMAWVEDAPNALERYGRMMAVEDKRAHTFDRVTPQEEGVARVKNIRLMFEKMCDGGLMGSEL